MQEETMQFQLEGHILQKRYHVKQCLTKGGMAWIYQAFDELEQREIALKILFSELTHTESILDRFNKEFSIHQQLDHPTILKAYQFIQEDDLVGYTMEYIEGLDLKQYLEQQQKELSTQEIKEIFLPVVEAMAHAHQQGIIHRDLKPGNILLAHHQGRWQPKVIDFGIAKQINAPSRTLSGSKLGTPEYMAPEQYQDSKNIDHRADIYSLGIILYRMMTGNLPFSGTYHSIVHKKLEGRAPYPTQLPVPLAGLLLRCLEKEPEARYHSCEHLGAVLTKFFHFHEEQALMNQPPTMDTELSIPSFEGFSSEDTFPTEPEELSGGETVISTNPLQNTTSSGGNQPTLKKEPFSIDFDAELQQAIQLAQTVQEEEKHARLKTVAVDDSHLIDELRKIDEENQVHQTAKKHSFQHLNELDYPLWKLLLAGSLLLGAGLLLGWFFAQKSF